MSQRFIVTKEHRRFTEFADAVRRGHTIGLCFGSAGVGKTLSARRYAHYEKAHDLLTYWGPRSDNDAKIYAALNRSRTVLYTPSVLTTPRTLKDELTQAITRTNMCIEQHLVPPGTATPEAWGWRHGRNYVELIIVDEAERLRPAALELLRDRYDRDDIALILIGMPGLEKQFSHYPQFYSRVGFAHQYRPLGQDELLFVLERHWRSLGKTLDPDDFTDAQAIAAIARITRGNFRLLERLFPESEIAAGDAFDGGDCLGVGEVLGVQCASQAFPMPVEDEEELFAAECPVAVGEAEAAVELRVVAESLVDAGHADEDHRKVGAVVVVAEDFQGGRGESFGFVNDEQFHQFADAVHAAGLRRIVSVEVLIDAPADPDL